MGGSAAFSPDGSRIVTASDDNTARLWDAKTRSCARSLSGHTDQVVDAAFSPDGARVVTASWTTPRGYGTQDRRGARHALGA